MVDLVTAYVAVFSFFFITVGVMKVGFWILRWFLKMNEKGEGLNDSQRRL